MNTHRVIQNSLEPFRSSKSSQEAKTSQKVPKWIELVIYSTQKLRAFLELLTVESIQKFNYLELLDLSDKVEFENFEYIFRNDSLQNYKKY